MRSYRAGNSFNRQTQPDSDTDYLGQEQLQWLKTALKDSFRHRRKRECKTGGNSLVQRS